MKQLQTLKEEQITLPLFEHFDRCQYVTHCRRKINGRWMDVENPFVEQWNREDYLRLCDDLRRTIRKGGVVYGLFSQTHLKGFASVESAFFGSRCQYLELSSLHVSAECRGQGMGRLLMDACKQWAREKGAEMLYISAHSSVESQAFYAALGCREAREYSPPHVEKEPFDCQLEVDV